MTGISIIFAALIIEHGLSRIAKAIEAINTKEKNA